LLLLLLLLLLLMWVLSASGGRSAAAVFTSRDAMWLTAMAADIELPDMVGSVALVSISLLHAANTRRGTCSVTQIQFVL
jgi:hypothetical protein